VTGSQASPGHVVAQQGIVDHDVAVIVLLPNLCKKVILHSTTVGNLSAN
jgi:hypothetical protein